MEATRIDMLRMQAKTFVVSKQRLPKSQIELIEWLLEFDRYAWDLALAMQKNFEDYVSLATRPIIMAECEHCRKEKRDD